jgi:hypothetical protein
VGRGADLGLGLRPAPAAAGRTVTESWTDRRPGALRLASVPVMGIADRAGHNRRGMAATLTALARTAEAT